MVSNHFGSHIFDDIKDCLMELVGSAGKYSSSEPWRGRWTSSSVVMRGWRGTDIWMPLIKLDTGKAQRNRISFIRTSSLQLEGISVTPDVVIRLNFLRRHTLYRGRSCFCYKMSCAVTRQTGCPSSAWSPSLPHSICMDCWGSTWGFLWQCLFGLSAIWMFCAIWYSAIDFCLTMFHPFKDQVKEITHCLLWTLTLLSTWPFQVVLKGSQVKGPLSKLQPLDRECC